MHTKGETIYHDINIPWYFWSWYDTFDWGFNAVQNTTFLQIIDKIYANSKIGNVLREKNHPLIFVMIKVVDSKN